MKKYLTIIFALFTLSLSAQSVVQGTIGSTGSTISNADGSVVLNFTLGQPFGAGEMTDGDLTLVQGLQGANVSIVEVSEEDETPEVNVGIGGFENLEATINFNPITGEIFLQGNNLEKISGEVLLSDISGRVLGRSSIQNGSIETVQLSKQSRSIYIITVLTDDQRRLSKKLIF